MFGLMVGFFNFNSTMGKRKKKGKKKKNQEKENLIYYHTFFMSPNILHIFTPTMCYLHSPHDMTKENVS